MNLKIKNIEPFGVLIEPTTQNIKLQEIPISTLQKLFHKHQLLVLRGFDDFINSDDFSDYCESWGEVSLWPFGKVLELQEQDQPEDHIFDHSYIPLHWDGMYRPHIPEYQIFHCVQAPPSDQGGQTTFCHTTKALNHASSLQIKNWSLITASYERKMEFYHSKTHSPLITQHPYKNISVIRYNEPPESLNQSFINPPLIHFQGIKDHQIKEFKEEIKQHLYDSKYFYAHEWKTGDILIADNLILLHGRREFRTHSPRHLRRVHVLSHTHYENPGLDSYQ